MAFTFEPEEKVNMYRAIGKRIKKVREEKGIPQSRMANDLGISQPNISKFENGKHFISLSTLVEYSVYFNVPISSLLTKKILNLYIMQNA